MDELLFVWDKAKDRANIRKHGVSFDEARTVFADEFARLQTDPDSSEGEQRFLLLGMSARVNILMVCLCERDHNTIRLISARKADRSERRQYEAFRHA